MNIQKAMENHHFIAGEIHYFYGHFPLLFVCSPEGLDGTFEWNFMEDLGAFEAKIPIVLDASAVCKNQRITVENI